MRKTRLAFAIVAGLALAPWAGPAARAQEQDTARAGAEADRRAALLRRFFDGMARELDLSPEQRAQLEPEMRAMQEERAALLREQRELRREMQEAARRGELDDETARRLLDRAAQLKAREAELWRRDQERLGRTLSPRQRLRLLMMQERMAQRVQQMRRMMEMRRMMRMEMDRRCPEPRDRPGPGCPPAQRPPDRPPPD